ncbi:hydrolase [Cognatiyoonia sp. IB215182]|uniref:hydrolase n=1 Tax=Cognatiyoonia sp. IB215182 TaxID=3097353 RepID=UPI002A1751ED|nr:hydrolase [Cognatiyoonia sp. IB215182]MDX8354938.1 hydrolase [Cognatiyoonia sp. IB215182]
MDPNAFPPNDLSDNPTGCCPRFNPVGWDNQHLHFEDKKFLRATTRAAMHIPWNMGQVFTRVQGHIEEVDAVDPSREIVLSRDVSAWEAEHFFAVDKDVPGEEMTTLSGDFITRVFEGPYRRAKDFAHDMEIAAKALGKTAKSVYFFYTTCPKCAKTYGENYMVGVVEI